MSWPYYYTNGSGFSTDVPPRSERQQGLALVGLNCGGGMSETLNNALSGFSDEHMRNHYPSTHAVDRAPWLRSSCHPHPGICTCGFCPQGISYTGGVAPGGGLPIRLPDPELEYLSQLAHRPLPKLDNTVPAGLGPDKAVKWRDIPRVPPNWAQIPPKPPGWDELDVRGDKYVRHTAECPRLRNRTFWCSCGAEPNAAFGSAAGPARCPPHCAYPPVPPPPRRAKKGFWGRIKSAFGQMS